MTTPKQQFAKHPYHGAFQQLTANPDFILAVNYAMLEFVTRYQVSAEQLLGANALVRIMMTLADPENETVPVGPEVQIRPDPARPTYRPNK